MEQAGVRHGVVGVAAGVHPFRLSARHHAETVLRRMRGRAILADEVGLGKTIEAGLVLAELRMRGLADRALVVTPAGLVGQWGEELERKFALPPRWPPAVGGTGRRIGRSCWRRWPQRGATR
jgi:hypothetical protein